jgi:ribosomal protein S18 acetylase RimI-like enzyme
MAPLVSPDGWTGLVLVYQTALPLDDAPALRREIDQIWQRFVLDVVQSHYDKALIVAQAQAASGAAAPATTQFRFTAQGDGWCTAESAERIKAGLDAAFVRDFVARFDRLVEQRDGWAAALYLAPDWRGTATITERGKLVRSVLDRSQFVAAVLVADQQIEDYRHRREISAIAVDPDGRSARIESRETETFRRGVDRIRSDGRSVDVLKLIDDHVQLIESSDEAINSVD